MSLPRAIVRLWNDEAPFALRSKQFIASVLPEKVLLALKKRYYARLLRSDSDALMETDARAAPLFVKTGDFVIDVGAFVGFYTNRLSKLVGPTGQVWSFEPMPQTYEILAAGIQRLGLPNVRSFPYAVSDTEGKAVMVIPHYKGGGESWWDAKIVDQEEGRGLRRFEITKKTLDSLLAGTDRPVTFIKIDAEYHEFHCIRGAVESLRRWHPVVQVETLESVDTHGSEPHAMVELLASLGYGPYRFDGTRFHRRLAGEKQQNLFFLCDHHVRAL